MLNRFIAQVVEVDKSNWSIKFTVPGLFDKVNKYPVAKRLFNTTREVLEDDKVLVLYDNDSKDGFVYTQLYNDDYVGLKHDLVNLDITTGKTLKFTIGEDDAVIEITADDSGNIDMKIKGSLTTNTESSKNDVYNSDVSIETKTNMKLKAINLTVEGTNVNITGGNLTVNGTAVPGIGPFCGIPNCLFTGAPHGSNNVQGT